MDETEATQLPDDVVREILRRVPTDDVAALFRCAVTCKQWRAVVADLSFLRRRWPENACHPSSLLGLFQYRDPGQPTFFPVAPGSVLGARPRPLASFVSDAPPPGDYFNRAQPLAARGDLLLVRLAATTAGEPLRLVVCNILTGTWDVLPPLNCTVSQCGCAILAREDCCASHGKQTASTGYSTLFKVLAMVKGSSNDRDCNLYTFSSSETRWREPRKCFNEVRHRGTFGLRILLGTNTVVVCRGVPYWLGSYSTDQWRSPRYFTVGVDVKTDRISLTELPIPADQLATGTNYELMLSVTIDGRLMLLHLQEEGRFRLNTWTRGNDGAWLRTRVIELKPPEQAWNPGCVAMLPGEKSGALFTADVYGRVHKIDPETGVMEDLTNRMFQDSLGTRAVLIEVDLLALFMSRLA